MWSPKKSLGILRKAACLTTSYDIRCEISEVCTQGILVLLYILQATKLKMNTEFGMSLGLKSLNGFQMYPSIHIVSRRQQQRFADSF